MNTYRISITTARGRDRGTAFCEFDVDALQPFTAILRALESRPTHQLDTDLITITSQLYAKDIFPLNGKTIREIAA